MRTLRRGSSTTWLRVAVVAVAVAVAAVQGLAVPDARAAASPSS